MRGILLLTSIVFSTFFLCPTLSFGQCHEMNSERKESLLIGSSFDNFRMTKIENAKDPYEVQFQVDLLKNYTYKLIFDMSAKSEGVIVKLYDLGPKNKVGEPKLIYTSTEDIMDENAIFDISFKAPKTRMLVKYEVKDATYEGCVTFLLGYFKNEKSKTLN